MKKRFLALFLVFVMLVSLFPAGALADGESAPPDTESGDGLGETATGTPDGPETAETPEGSALPPLPEVTTIPQPPTDTEPPETPGGGDPENQPEVPPEYGTDPGSTADPEVTAVTVVFVCEPADTVIWLWDVGHLNVNGEPGEIGTAEGNVFTLTPGEYLYDAVSADAAYESLKKCALTVAEPTPPETKLTVSVTLQKVEQPETPGEGGGGSPAEGQQTGGTGTTPGQQTGGTNLVSGTCGPGLSWTLDRDTGVLTVSGTGAMDSFGTVGAPWDRYKSTIRTVTVEPGVTGIGENAFYSYPALTAVTLPEGLTGIGSYAFFGCHVLASVALPGTLTEIGDHAFYCCTALTGVTLPEGLARIKSSAFSGSGLTSVTLPGTLTELGGAAFMECTGLTDIEIPAGVTVISHDLFDGCTALQSVTIPAGVTKIEYYAFYGCSQLRDVYYGGSQKQWKSLSIGDGNGPLTAAALHPALPDPPDPTMNWSFDAASGTLSVTGTGPMPDWTSHNEVPWASLRGQIRSVTVGAGVTAVGDCAFKYCENLTGVSLPDGLTEIGMSAFSSCEKLTGITIPESVTAIGMGAFSFSGLLSATLPGGMTAISGDTFSNCGHLAAVAIPAGVTEIGVGAFAGCYALKDVYYAGTRADWDRIAIGDVNVCLKQAALHTAPDYSCGPNLGWYFDGSSGALVINGTGPMDDWTSDADVPWYSLRTQIRSVVLSDGVTTIGSYAFYYCYSMTDITLPEGLTGIGGAAFYGCGSLAQIALPRSVRELGACALAFCGALKRVSVPEGVTALAGYVFYGSGLTEVSLPASLTAVSDSAFGGCGSLAAVNYAGTRADWSRVAIGADNDPLRQARLVTGDATRCGPALTWSFNSATGTLSINGTGAMDNWAADTDVPWYSIREQIRSVVLASGVTTVGSYAFYYCYALTGINFPEGLTEIGDAAFYGCGSLAAVSFPASVRRIGYCTFAFCIALKEVAIPAGVADIYPYAFYSCLSMTGLTLPESVAKVWQCAFHGCSALAEVSYAGTRAEWGRVTIEEYNDPLKQAKLTPGDANKCGENLTWSFNASQGVLTITGTGPMDNWAADTGVPWYSIREQIRSVKLASGVTTVGSYAFYYCYAMTNITLPKGLTEIGDAAFYGCGSLASVTIPASVRRVGYCTFAFCIALKSVSIPAGVADIYPYAFYSCLSMTDLTLPESVTKVWQCAFHGCSALATVSYTGTQTGWSAITVEEYNGPLRQASLTCQKSASSEAAGLAA